MFPTWYSENFLQKRVSPTGLALFRICFSLVLLWDVLILWQFRHLIFDPILYQEGSGLLFKTLLPCWIVAASLMLLGCLTRVATICNFVCSSLILGDMLDYEYHYDHVCQGINFLLLFAPVSEVWSIDACWKNRRTGLAQSVTTQPAATVHPIYYYAFMFVGIGLTYFDSALWKLEQTSWRQGFGVWRPMSSPPFTWPPTAAFQFLLNQRWFMQFSNYLTLFLEIVFVFLMWSRRCRLWILLPLGLTLHIGIVLAFPIPKFSFVMVALYVLVVPPELWDRLTARIKLLLGKVSDTAKFTASEQTSVSRWNHRYAVNGILILLIVMAGLQGLIIVQDHQLVIAEKFSPAVREKLNRYMGLCTHGVFLDPHWNNYDHVIALVYARPDGTFEWLPLTSPTGQMGSLAIDRLWANWAFRLNCAPIDNTLVEKGVKRVTAYWLAMHDMPLDKAKFLVLTKALQPYTEWRENELSEQMLMPWQVSGDVTWQTNDCKIQLLKLSDTKPLSKTDAPLIPALVSPFAAPSTAAVERLGTQQIHIHR